MYSELIETLRRMQATAERLRAEAAALRAQADRLFVDSPGDAGEASPDAADD